MYAHIHASTHACMCMHVTHALHSTWHCSTSMHTRMKDDDMLMRACTHVHASTHACMQCMSTCNALHDMYAVTHERWWHANACMGTHTCIHTCTHTCAHAFMHASAHTYTAHFVHMHGCIHAIHAHVTHACICMHAPHACMHALRMRVCACGAVTDASFPPFFLVYRD
jgi:hypothetical protein